MNSKRIEYSVTALRDGWRIDAQVNCIGVSAHYMGGTKDEAVAEWSAPFRARYFEMVEVAR